MIVSRFGESGDDLTGGTDMGDVGSGCLCITGTSIGRGMVSMGLGFTIRSIAIGAAGDKGERGWRGEGVSLNSGRGMVGIFEGAMTSSGIIMSGIGVTRVVI